MYLGRKGLCIETVLTIKDCQLLASSECHSARPVMAGAEERRAEILRDYHELTRTHPNLPAQLRDFQVKEIFQKTVSQYIWNFLGWYLKQCPGQNEHQPHHGGSSHWLWEEPPNASVGPPYAPRFAYYGNVGETQTLVNSFNWKWHFWMPKTGHSWQFEVWDETSGVEMSHLEFENGAPQMTLFPHRLHSFDCVASDNNWGSAPSRLSAHGHPCCGRKQGISLNLVIFGFQCTVMRSMDPWKYLWIFMDIGNIYENENDFRSFFPWTKNKNNESRSPQTNLVQSWPKNQGSWLPMLSFLLKKRLDSHWYSSVCLGV